MAVQGWGPVSREHCSPPSPTLPSQGENSPQGAPGHTAQWPAPAPGLPAQNTEPPFSQTPLPEREVFLLHVLSDRAGLASFPLVLEGQGIRVGMGLSGKGLRANPEDKSERRWTCGEGGFFVQP